MGWLSKVFRRTEEAPAVAAEPQHAQEARDTKLREAYDRYSTGRLAEAEGLLRELGEQDPPDPDALYFLAVLAVTNGRALEAADVAQRAIAVRPADPGLWFMLAVAYHNQNLLGQAVDAWRTALRLDPGDALVRTNLGAALIDSGNFDEGRVELESVLATGYESASVQYNLCVVYRDQGRIDEAIAACRRAVELKDDDKMTYTNLLLTLNYSEKVDAALLYEEHLKFGARFAKPYNDPPIDRAWPRRLRVGYISPDFRSHVVACFAGPILANHDRSRFEVFCYYTHRIEDRTTEYLRGLAEHWLDCVHMSDADLAQMVREDRIDILVDLAGHTGDNRLLVFAEKPAPVQMSYLGYPNTTGITAIDYRITDDKADPPGPDDRFNVEALLRPWPTYFSFGIPRADCPDPGPLPAATNGYVTFGCFNNMPKLSPPFLDATAEVLKAVPGSRLRIKSRTLSVPHVAERLRERFRKAGIDLARLDLRGWEDSYGGHMGAYQGIDIALDSFPYTGATTTCEALWMGVPVISLRGNRHAARVGDSLLSAVGLRELVADDVAGYVSRAASLASDLDRLAGLRAGLREQMGRSPLRDEQGFTRALEATYLEVWKRKLAAAVARPPKSAQAIAQMLSRLSVLRAEGRKIEAEEACKEVLREQADNVEALTALWDLSYETRNHGVAVEWLRRGIAANPDSSRLHYMMGYSLSGLGNMPDAVAALRKAVELEPSMAKGHNNLGCALEAMGNLGEAIACYQRACELDPALADSLYNLGNARRQLGEPDEAIDCIERALRLDPARADWRCNLGDLLLQKLRLDEALACYQAALAMDADLGRAHQGRASVRQLMGEARAAQEDLRRAMELDPKDASVHSAWLLGLHYERGDESLLAEHREWARVHARGLGRQAARAAAERRPLRRINIGYVSPDFKRHSVADFFMPLLQSHDRSRFKVFCYSSAPFPDLVTRSIAQTTEEWRDISRVGDEWVADRIRADRIDILVDLAGHTAGGRLLLFARKPGPVQVTWLGYPDTSGLGAIDYRITDAIADPVGPADERHSEKLVRLPGGFLCYAPHPEAPEPGEPPMARSGAVTFGSFGNLAKLTPPMVQLWSRLLAQVPGSRLALKSFGLASHSVQTRLREEFAAHGIAPERLVLAGPREGFASHLEHYGAVDIALDVFPYNGAATTCEALWMGVPVITLCGQAHVSRVGASVLACAGLPELVASSAEDYLDKAVALARDGGRLATLRRSMRERLRASPLLDGRRFAAEFEAACVDMWERWVESQATVEVTVPLPVVPGKA